MMTAIVGDRMILLKTMDQIIRSESTSDEGYAFTRWITEGIPDGADYELYEEIAEDDDMWSGICELFGELMRITKRG